jgi:hypothetical protein
MEAIAEVDRLAGRIINSLHGLLGVSYSERFEHYIYQGSILFADAAAIGASGNVQIRISQEAAFFCTAIRCGCRVDRTGNIVTGASTDGLYAAAAGEGDGGVPDAPYLLQITDGGNDRLLHSEPVDAGLVYGTHGNSPMVLSKPKLFKPNASVNVSCTLLKAAVGAFGFDVRVALMGFKVYKGEGATAATVRVR